MAAVSRIVPVLFVLLFGSFLKRKGILEGTAAQALKNLVTTFLLPVVLFHALATIHYSADTGRLVLVMMAAELCAFGMGFVLRRFAGREGKLIPFLMCSFEGGMVGYPLYGILCGEENLSNIAAVDIANTCFVFSVYLALLMATASGTFTKKAMADSVLHSTVFWGVAAGILLGVTGLMERFLATPAAQVYLAWEQMVTSPVSFLILLAVGYDLSFDGEMIRRCLKPVIWRFAVTGTLLLGALFLLRPVLREEAQRAALILYMLMPPTYVISSYTKEEEDAAFVSTATSLYTLVSVAVFAVMSGLYRG